MKYINQHKLPIIVTLGIIVLSLYISCESQSQKLVKAQAEKAVIEEKVKIELEKRKAEEERGKAEEERKKAEETKRAMTEIGDGLRITHDSASSGNILKNIQANLNRVTGVLKVTFDFNDDNKNLFSTRIVFRFFDENGTYLTHFRTSEVYVNMLVINSLGAGPNFNYNGPIFLHGQRLLVMKRVGNRLQYELNLRDTPHIKIVAIDFGGFEHLRQS